MQLFEYDFKAMGSPCQVQCYSSSEISAQKSFRRVHLEVQRLERKYSRYLRDSLLSTINQYAGHHKAVPLDIETQAIFNYAQKAYELSEGLFDITSGVLRKAWDFKSGQLPDRQTVECVLPLVGWEKIQWHGNSISLPEKGMEIDLGGIVKEYAVDRAVALLKHSNVVALVNLGGDIGVTDTLDANHPWQVGIRHPRKNGDSKIASIPLTQGAVAASGDYERFIEVQGQRYGHILNPKTGYPIQNGLATVSVWTNRCVLAGTLTTIAMLKGRQGLSWLNDIEVPYVAVDCDMLLHNNNL